MTEARIVSFSELQTARHCPLKHQLSYVERWTKEHDALAPTSKGTAWHAVLEEHYNTIKKHQDAAQTAQYPWTSPGSLQETLQACRQRVSALIEDVIAPRSPELADLIRWAYAGHLACQPPNTMVTVATWQGGGRQPAIWTQVPIQDVKPGDRVVSWAKHERGVGWVSKSGKPVTRVGTRHYRGNLIEAATASHSSRYTADHIAVAIIGEEPARWAVYLMRKGDQFRIGHAKWRTGSKGHLFGPVHRARTEKADAVWVLNGHDTKESAWLAEMTAAHRYGIPTQLFRSGAFPSDQFWAAVGPNVHRAVACLNAYGRDIKYPLWELGGAAERWMIVPKPIRACNLMDGMRLLSLGDIVPGPRGEIRAPHTSEAWQPVKVRRVAYDGPVYSLEVADDHTYFADGLLTHNCYGLDEEWRVVAVEHQAVCRLPTPTGRPSGFKLKMKIDLIVGKLTQSGAKQLWVVDHKFVSNLPKGKELDLDDQFGLYTWGLRKMGKTVFGQIYDAARSQRLVGEAKVWDGNTDQDYYPGIVQPLKERFQRTPMYRTDIELDTIAVEAYLTAKARYQQQRELSRAGVDSPRHTDPQTCRYLCDYTEPCLAGRKGADLREYLDAKGYRQDFTRH